MSNVTNTYNCLLKHYKIIIERTPKFATTRDEYNNYCINLPIQFLKVTCKAYASVMIHKTAP